MRDERGMVEERETYIPEASYTHRTRFSFNLIERGHMFNL